MYGLHAVQAVSIPSVVFCTFPDGTSNNGVFIFFSTRKYATPETISMCVRWGVGGSVVFRTIFSRCPPGQWFIDFF